MLVLLLASAAGAVAPRYDFVIAWDNVADGDWYRDATNEDATLAWGESYVMSAFAAMYRATRDPIWLERLAWHADGVLAQRDEVRGVADWRGLSGPCWRNTSYQAEPYCYAVHTGMIAAPLVEFALLVERDGLHREPTRDGVHMGGKALEYVAIAEAAAAWHDDEWSDDGAYVFPAEATFLAGAGDVQPLNQSNAMGRLHVLLWQATGDARYRTKAEALATRLRDQLTVDGDAYVWNYAGGPYVAPGEDVSHAAISVDFAVRCAEAGLVFDDADLQRFAATFTDNVLVDDGTFADHVGGGATNGTSYRPQVGRWLALSRVRPGIWAAVRDLYADDYAPDGIASGSLLLAQALLAEHEPPACAPFFYTADWSEPDGDGWREATAYGANVLTVPPDLAAGCVMPLELDAPRPLAVQQWDGSAYHDVARLRAGGPRERHVAYDPRWPHVYAEGGVLFQLADAFVDGDGVRARIGEAPSAPSITSGVPSPIGVDDFVAWPFTASGTGPVWWSVLEFPVGMRIEPDTGVLRWRPPEPGTFPVTVRVESAWGEDVVSFALEVVEEADTGVPDTGSPRDSDDADGTDAGCGCASGQGAGWAPLAAVGLLLARRKRRISGWR